MTREERIELIADLCAEHNCKEKIAKIHHDQFVNHKWHPHPSKEFEEWFVLHLDYREGVKTKIAWNCQCYRDEFMEAKKYGVVSVS